MRVLGLDPAATGPTGYGIVEGDGRQCRLLHYGALKIAANRRKEGEGAALQEVHARLCGLIDEFAPDVLAVEGIFSALNVRTALRLAEVRGVVLLAAAQHGVEVCSYAPREVKAAAPGRARGREAGARDPLDERNSGTAGRCGRVSCGVMPFAKGTNPAAVRTTY